MKENLNKKLNQPSMPDSALEALVSLASKKLGVTPDVLRTRLSDGSLEKAVRSSSDPRIKEMSKALDDPSLAEKLVRKMQQGK